MLALDIGAGTEDILLFDDSKKSIENCVKMVIPSSSQVFAAEVRDATRRKEDVFIKGDVIGGGAFAYALREHAKKDLRALMTENAAYAVRNNLDEVRRLGIEVVDIENMPEDFSGRTITVTEVNISKLQTFLENFGEALFDVDIVGVAVQDHGVFPKGASNRRFRIEKIKELLSENQRPETLGFEHSEIPDFFLRMKSAAQASKRQLANAEILAMDTSPDAIIGCLKDPVLDKADPILAINVGNLHTMAAIVSDGAIVGILEHHTRLLTPQKARQILVNFADGQLTDNEVFNDGGHGMFFFEDPPGFSELKIVAATGPNRNVLASTNLNVHYAAPAGDVMMTGPVGLVEAARYKFQK